MAKKSSATAHEPMLRDILDCSSRDFADFLDIPKTQLLRFETGITTLPEKARNTYDDLQKSIQRGIIIRDAVSEFREEENANLLAWQTKRRENLMHTLASLERKLTKMEADYNRGIEVLRKLSCIEFTSTGRALQSHQSWHKRQINEQKNKLLRFDLRQQAELQGRIAGVRGELGVVENT